MRQMLMSDTPLLGSSVQLQIVCSTCHDTQTQLCVSFLKLRSNFYQFHETLESTIRWGRTMRGQFLVLTFWSGKISMTFFTQTPILVDPGKNNAFVQLPDELCPMFLPRDQVIHVRECWILITVLLWPPGETPLLVVEKIEIFSIGFQRKLSHIVHLHSFSMNEDNNMKNQCSLSLQLSLCCHTPLLVKFNELSDHPLLFSLKCDLSLRVH